METVIDTLLVFTIYKFANAATNYTNQGLDKIPVGIPTHTSILLLTKNNITDVAAEQFSGLNHLKELYFDFNKLQVFPNFSYISSSLESLFLSNNEITAIPESNLDNLVQLKQLILSYNHLTSIPNVVGPSRTLTKLNLLGNNLKDVPCLTDLGRNLKDVSFNENQIESIDASCFHALGPGTIKEMTFRGNNIITIPKRFDLSPGVKIIVMKNPIMCDACIGWMLEEDLQISGKCKSPLHLVGRDLYDLTLADLEEPPGGEGACGGAVSSNSGKLFSAPITSHYLLCWSERLVFLTCVQLCT